MKVEFAPILVDVLTACANEKCISHCGVRSLTFIKDEEFTEITISRSGVILVGTSGKFVEENEKRA